MVADWIKCLWVHIFLPRRGFHRRLLPVDRPAGTPPNIKCRALPSSWSCCYHPLSKHVLEDVRTQPLRISKSCRAFCWLQQLSVALIGTCLVPSFPLVFLFRGPSIVRIVRLRVQK